MLELVGTRIKELRKDVGISQSELGKILGVSQDTISLWERSKSLPDAQCIVSLATYFGVSCDYILGCTEV